MDKLRITAVRLLFGLLWLAAAANPASAQEKAAPLKPQLIGTWVLADVYFDWQDGRKTQPYGPNVRGRLVLDTGDLFSFQIIGANRPKFKGSNRRDGTAEENAIAVGQTESFFGTYSINEADHTIAAQIDRAIFPNWDGTERKYKIVLNDNEMRMVSPLNQSAAGNYVPTLWWKRHK